MDDIHADTAAPQRCFAFSAGFFRDRRVNRILTLAGYAPRLGWPTAKDAVLVWGHSPYAHRGEWVAARTGARLIRVEDAFFRSVLPGRSGDAPLGLVIDDLGCHFHAARPSRIEAILAGNDLDSPALIDAAAAALDFAQTHRLSKYNATPLDGPRPDPGYVLVVDQTRGDASIHHAGATAATFHTMLTAARDENPGARILIKTHPETAAGLRAGHFTAADGELWDAPTPVADLLAGASAVYTVSSTLGAEAIYAGHTPVVFGVPFYAGWGLTDDRAQIPDRRGHPRTAAQLFAAANILAATWYDPSRDDLCDVTTALRHLAADTRAWRDDHAGWDMHGMRLWKRKPLTQFFGGRGPVRFDPKVAKAPAMVWGVKEGPGKAARLEDGFLRSNGLGAQLIPPMSLILDDIGIYFDPQAPSRMEALIAASVDIGAAQSARALALRDAIVAAGVSKYNLSARGDLDLPPGRKILVPGQVEDDASILRGTVDIATNAALLQAARDANPDAILIYKPHPDVEAGLRQGAVPDAGTIADVVAQNADPIALIDQVDEVWTMTSLLGFEALIRGKSVTCVGLPFYAGWGLTTDRHAIARRRARPSLAGLIHAALIDAPRYFDPVTGRPCPPEVVVQRLADGSGMPRGPGNRVLAKAQGALASYAHLWR